MNLEHKSSQLGTLFMLSLIWGSSFILMKKGLESYSSLQVAALRMFFSFVFILPFSIKNLKVLNRDNIRSLILVGYLGFGIPAILFTTAQTRITSSLAGILNSLTPLFTLIIGVLVYRSRASRTSIIGIFVGLLGAMGLVLERSGSFIAVINEGGFFAGIRNDGLFPGFSIDGFSSGICDGRGLFPGISDVSLFTGDNGGNGLFARIRGGGPTSWIKSGTLFTGINAYALLVVAATICYGVNVNEVKYKLAHLTSLEITSLSFLLVGPAAGIYLLFTDWSPVVQTDGYMMNLGFIALLALFSSIIAVLIFNYLIKFTTALFASSVTYIIPVFAILWGISDGESISLLQLLWIGVILLAVYLVNK